MKRRTQNHGCTNPMPSRHSFVFLLLAGLLMSALPQATQAQTLNQGGDQGPVEVFGDWHMRCQNNQLQDGSTIESCALFQNLINPENNRLIMQVAAGYWGADRRSGIIIKLPLGVILPAGIEVSVDDKPVAKVPYFQCFPDGCQANIPADQNLIAAMQAGIAGKVTFRNPANQARAVGFSLKGFTKGFAQAK